MFSVENGTATLLDEDSIVQRSTMPRKTILGSLSKINSIFLNLHLSTEEPLFTEEPGNSVYCPGRRNTNSSLDLTPNFSIRIMLTNGGDRCVVTRYSIQGSYYIFCAPLLQVKW